MGSRRVSDKNLFIFQLLIQYPIVGSAKHVLCLFLKFCVHQSARTENALDV